MEIETRREKTHILKMSEHEAKILKALIQNPQHPDEAKEFREFREFVFNLLTENGVDFL